jgi:hypothetical protein
MMMMTTAVHATTITTAIQIVATITETTMTGIFSSAQATGSGIHGMTGEIMTKGPAAMIVHTMIITIATGILMDMEVLRTIIIPITIIPITIIRTTTITDTAIPRTIIPVITIGIIMMTTGTPAGIITGEETAATKPIAAAIPVMKAVAKNTTIATGAVAPIAGVPTTITMNILTDRPAEEPAKTAAGWLMPNTYIDPEQNESVNH